MPILYRPSAVPPDPPVVNPPLVIPPPVAPTFTWTSPAGRVTDFAVFGGEPSGFLVPPGATGLGMPEWAFYETTSPGFDGSTVRDVRAAARDIDLPLHLWGATREDTVALWHRLVADMNPRKGAGLLTLTDRQGRSRSIRAYYTGGLQGQDDDQAWGMHHLTAVVSLRAPSPYWLGPEVNKEFRNGAAGLFFPILPLAVTESQVLGEVEIVNDGDAETYPVWTITGPATSVTLTNATTGQTLAVAQALTTGQTLKIDTREGRKSVVLNAGTNAYAKLGLTSTLWPLAEGSNKVTLDLPGSTPATSLTLAYQVRYLSAY